MLLRSCVILSYNVHEMSKYLALFAQIAHYLDKNRCINLHYSVMCQSDGKINIGGYFNSLSFLISPLRHKLKTAFCTKAAFTGLSVWVIV